MAIAGAYVDRLGGCAEGLHRVVAGGRRGENIAAAIDALFLLGNHAWLTGQWAQLRLTAREGLDRWTCATSTTTRCWSGRGSS
ncbi:hypothetical protein [Streptomyces mirabilis]|uniref:hypothetical protein n=1 Tax=Streptomyces mirabilis TaxID=68239 RepID=UPI0036CAAEA0